MTAQLAATMRLESLQTIEMSEWGERHLEGVTLSESARIAADSLRVGGEGRLQVDELRDGLRLQARSYVGVVALDQLEIRISPKCAGGSEGLVRLIELVSGIDGLSRLRGHAAIQAAGPNLFDLLALLFAEACEQVIRRGLLTGYVEHEEELPVVRGRILGDRQVLRRFGRLDRIHCRFDEIENDVDENRLIGAVLQRIHPRATSPMLRRKIARLRTVFESICSPADCDPIALRYELAYNRLNQHYQPAHALGWMLLDGLAIGDLLAKGSTQMFAFLLDMNALFEQFATRLVRHALREKGARVHEQASHRSILWDAIEERSYARVTPDLLVEMGEGRATRICVDAKYKLYDEKKISSEDTYQAFLYAFALGARPGGGPPATLILYPASPEGSARRRLEVRPFDRRGAAAEIWGLGVRIPEALNEVMTGTRGPETESIASAFAELTSLRSPR